MRGGAPPPGPIDVPAAGAAATLRNFFSVFRFSRRGLALVRDTSRGLLFALAALTVLAGLVPAAIAWVGAHIVDAVVRAMNAPGHDPMAVLRWVLIEGALVIVMAAAQRGLSLTQSLLRAQLGQRVNVMILEKALTLDLHHFEDSEFYDRLTRARREASVRPLSLVMRTFGLLQNLVTLVTYAVLLVRFSPWTMLILLLAGLPGFIAEAKFSGDAFRLFRWRSPETRMQMYLETVLAREDSAKEVKLFGLGPRFLQRYRDIFGKLYREDRALSIRRDRWGFGLGLLGTVTLYGAYAWIAWSAVRGAVTLGQMTMYLALFRQGQGAVSAILSAVGGMYEDNLYLSTLYEYLETPVAPKTGVAVRGPDPSDGIRFEHVTFTYPGATEATLSDIDLHLPPGGSLALVGENGSGKTTLIKLLTHLYEPTSGRILFEGRDVRDWDEQALRARIGVIFQDFARYQLPVGENVGAGDEPNFEDEARWRDAAGKGRAAEFIEELPRGYATQLGKWFRDGRELSGGQWQKIALSRAFMRTQADVLVLDEPTAGVDIAATHSLLEFISQIHVEKKLTILLVTHDLPLVRKHAQQVIWLHQGKVLLGTTTELLSRERMAEIFEMEVS